MPLPRGPGYEVFSALRFPATIAVVAGMEQVISWLVPTTAEGGGAAATSAEDGEDGRSYFLAESDLKPLAAKVEML